MKKLITLSTALLFTAIVFAQVPQKMSYQAVIRNSTDKLVTSQAVGMQISILQGSETGAVVYTETQTTTTNVNGLVSIEIGGGTGFDIINWVNGPYFIKTETDPLGGTNYTITGTSQLLSVPFALFSASTGDTTTWKKNGPDIYFNNGNVGIGTSNPQAQLEIAGKINVRPISSNTNELFVLDAPNETTVRLYTDANSGFPSDLLLGTYPNGHMNQLFLKQSNGYVGVGTTTPVYKLDVNGDINTNGAFKVNGTSLATIATSGDYNDLINTPVGTTPGQMLYWNGTAWVYITSGLNGQILKYKNGIPTWSDGSINDLNIGDSYQGGIIAYFFQPGDPGYDANIRHGIIAATSDQSAAEWGCFGTAITGAGGIILGTGNQNTIDIVTGCLTTGIAAEICANLTIGIYSDWYLPSRDELIKLYLNQTEIGGFYVGAFNFYWSSSQSQATDAIVQDFNTGGQTNRTKSSPTLFRAIRSF